MFQSFDQKGDRGFAAAHLPLVRAEMAAEGLDYLIVPHSDEYQNEYTPDYAQRLTWISGFTGSAGAAVVGAETAVIFTDGRYTLQVRDEVDGDLFDFQDSGEYPLSKWIELHVDAPAKIGYDPMLHTRAGVKMLTAAAKKAGAELIATHANVIDRAWADQPPRPSAPVSLRPARLSGASPAEKRAGVAAKIKDAGAEVAVIASPASVAWAFDIRGADVAHTPLALARALVRADATAQLFIDPAKTGPELAEHIGEGAATAAEDALAGALGHLGASGARVLIDPADAPAWFFDRLEGAGANVIEGRDPCVELRAVKTQAEQAGARAAHVRDGVALTRFLHWLAQEAPGGGVDEIAAVTALEGFRSETGALMDVSFDTISGSGPNGAIVHYRVTERTNRKLQAGELFLVDSGAQYEDGTTDVTRTVAIGAPGEEMRRRFTLVLKGHIAIAALRFPEGTAGAHLDAFARAALWRAGLDYDHGTGHGVGSYLGVHEGPQSISKRLADVALKPGMIVSNEPGYYKTGAYGIRIENLVLVRPPEPVPGGERDMLSFETLTLAPIDRTLIIADMLSEDERTWLNAYRKRVRETLTPELPEDVADWLDGGTRDL